MTAEERYARCRTLEELNREFRMDKMSAESWEFLGACEKAHRKRYNEILDEKERKNDPETE